MLARNRNILSFGLVAALVSGFSSCTEVPVDTQQLVNHQVHDEYVANFVAKYGQPSPNQTWDFSGRPVDDGITVLPYIENMTRAISSVASVDSSYIAPPDIKIDVLAPIPTSYNELAYINAYLNAQPTLDWEPNKFAVNDMWVYYAHSNDIDTNLGNQMHSLGIHSVDPTLEPHQTQFITGLPILGGAYANSWSYGSAWSGNSEAYGQRIDASALQDEKYQDFFWYAITNNYVDPLVDSYDIDAFREAYELLTYKEYVTPFGAVYWGFDCDRDGDYRDLVCLVEPTYVKRYMIEDLGALDDFDFNDIVVDVVSNKDGQKAIVRAMGGTLDFTITIGNTSWSKSGNGFEAETAYNADAGTSTWSTVTEFDVEGWDPDANNISVTVIKRKKTTETGSDVVISFPFPKAGEVPMIIALLPSQYLDTGETPRRYWMPERVSIPAKYFTEESTTEP